LLGFTVGAHPRPLRLLGRLLLHPVTLIGLALILAAWKLDSTPPVWWDEGWTLSVARNWAMTGYYGRLLDGVPSTPTLSAAFPVVAPIALSFRIFGVGVWQGRLSSVMFLAGALALLYFLARHLYQRHVARLTLVLLVVVFPHPSIYPPYLSRQALGELPMLFFLLAGYAACLAAWRVPRWWWVASLCWGIALDAKQQTFPFWLASLSVPLAALALRRQWRRAAWLMFGLIGSVAIWRGLDWLVHQLLAGYHAPAIGFTGLQEVTAIVFTTSARLTALKAALIFGLPVLCGLGSTAWNWLRRDGVGPLEEVSLVRSMLLVLTASWWAWFVLASAGWIRYFFPVAFLGSLFVAALLYDLTRGFDAHWIAATVRATLTTKRLTRQSVAFLFGTFLIALIMGLGARTLYRVVHMPGDTSVEETARFLNHVLPVSARIETYDSELFFLLERPYHYPPDQVHVDLIRRAFVEPNASIQYDPLAADPDYLVVGPFSQWTRLYAPVLADGAFRLWRTEGLYNIYQRVR
jgi:hypothetical protein